METTLKVALGEKLRILRTNAGYQQKEIASKFGIGQQAYSDLEMGQTNFTDKKVLKICEIFGITFHDFLTIEISDIKMKNKKISESKMMQVLKLNYEKELLRKEIRILELELELKKYKVNTVAKENIKPIYVMI